MYKKSVFVVLLAMLVLLSACNFPLAFDDTADAENAVAETLAALEEAESEVVVPTLALAPTSTTMPVEDAEDADEADEADDDDEDADVVVTATPKALCLSAQAWDLTVPDNTVIAAGEKFDKAWTFKNVGYCTWDEDFKVVFVKGDQMNAPSFKEFGVEVDPNEEAEMLIVMYAPSEAGTYRGEWQIQSADGVNFGPVWVQIEVE